jgi:hypothetical protein
MSSLNGHLFTEVPMEIGTAYMESTHFKVHTRLNQNFTSYLLGMYLLVSSAHRTMTRNDLLELG